MEVKYKWKILRRHEADNPIRETGEPTKMRMLP